MTATVLFVLFFLFYLQDRFLPIANVARVMKRHIPGNGKVSSSYLVELCYSWRYFYQQ